MVVAAQRERAPEPQVVQHAQGRAEAPDAVRAERGADPHEAPHAHRAAELHLHSSLLTLPISMYVFTTYVSYFNCLF